MTEDWSKVRCRSCKATEQYKMAKADGHFSLDDGRSWNNLTEDIKLGF